MALSYDGHLYVSGPAPRLTKMEHPNAFAVNFFASAKIVFLITHQGEVIQMRMDNQQTIPITPVAADGTSSFVENADYEHTLVVDEVLSVSNCVLLRNRTGSFHTLKVAYAKKPVDSDVTVNGSNM